LSKYHFAQVVDHALFMQNNAALPKHLKTAPRWRDVEGARSLEQIPADQEKGAAPG
jgi:hypothetical protein